LAADRSVLISTHQTEDVAALCRHVVVLRDGETLFAGAPRELAEVARDRVWLSDDRADGAELSWLTGDGRHRHVGHSPPPQAELVAPTLEDGYLLLAGRAVVVFEEPPA
jgi:ABC-2 type transport system ATP-binding protein